MQKIEQDSYSKQIYNNNIQYLVKWSQFQKYERKHIILTAPNFSGLYMVSYMKSPRLARPFYFGFTWINSIMYDIKTLGDKRVNPDERVRNIINNKECYYRFLIINNYKDMMDLLAYYSQNNKYKHMIFKKRINHNSGRFNVVTVKDYNDMIKY